MDVLTIHYNTPEMLEAMIKSLNKHTKCHVYVFDNSDEKPFVNTFDNVTVIDNTDRSVINFDEWLKRYPERKPRISNYGSAKHCKSVNICFKYLPRGFVLMDSDVLVKRDISELWDDRYAWVGEPHLDTPKGVHVMRALPFLCYINVPMCRNAGVRYFNSSYMWWLTSESPNRWYDTGAWFYRSTLEKLLPFKKIKIGDYIEHFGHGSHATLNAGLSDWLNENEELWK